MPAIIISIALGFLLQFFFMTLIGLSAFFIEDNLAMYLIFSKLTFMLGTFLPVEFLPPWLSNIAKALPFSYISWAPAKLFVDFSPALFLELVPRQAMWTAIIIVVTLICYRAGERNLQINGG
jgi:ABC-2 type transport system permease protein